MTKFKQTFLFYALLFSVLFSVLFSTAGNAQTTSATLAGRVTDESRAAISGATIEAIDTATNNSITATTNEDGRYIFTELRPGNYRLRVEQAGFQRAIKEDINLNVSARATQDFTLRVGEVSATVTVESSPTLIDRDTATVSTVVTRELVENIPLNGRSFQSLLELTPGVVLTSSSATNPGQFSVNGQRTNSNYFTLDGVSANAGTTPIATSSQQAAGTLPNTTVVGGFNNLASVDELQEFRVQTSTFAPEFGRTPGAQVSLVSRSGGNRVTGSIFNYVRNDIFDANTFFNNRSGIPRGKLRQNDFGFTVGGPMFLPRFGEGGPHFYDGRDKTFFFVSYEGLRLRQPVFRSANVPSLFARERAAALGLTEIGRLLAGFPLPNAQATTTDPFIGRFEQSLSNPVEVNSYGVRIDHNITSRLSLFGRYKYTPSSNDQATTVFPNQTNYFDVTTRLFTTGATYAATSKLAFDARANYTDSSADFLFTGQEIGGAQLTDLSTFLPSFVGESNSSVSVQFGSLINQTRGRSFGNGQRQLNLVGSTSIIAGNHQIKIGGDYRRLKPKVNARSFGFTYNFTSLSAAIENAATRGTALVSVQALAPAGQFTFENVSAFAQDTWRVTPRLTLTYGLRWDVNTPPSSDSALPYAINGLDNLLTATLAPAGTKAFEASYNNFAPRIGAAYTVDREGGLVVRGGFGVFNDLATGQATRGYTSFPFNSLTPSTRVAFAPGSAALNAALQPAPFNTNSPYASEFYVYDQNIKLPVTWQYNLSVEKSLGAYQSVTVSYVGSKGRRLLFTEVLRNTVADAVLPIPAKMFLNPIFGNGISGSNLYITDNRGKSDYNALQVQFERRLSRGLQAIASYTFAKSNDNISSEIAASAGVFRVNLDAEYAPSDFDIRHAFTAAVTYRIPSIFKEGFGKAALGGFAVDAITRARSAPPFNAFVSYSNASAGVSFINRPDLNTNLPLYLEDENLPGGRRVNPAALTAAPVTRQGTLERNALRAFPLFQTDVALRREFKLSERFRLQLRAEAFNVFNQANFAADSATLFTVTRTGTTQNLTFGQSNAILANQLSGSAGTGFNSLYSVGGARSMQFAVKILF
jgi:hypothetical protein